MGVSSRRFALAVGLACALFANHLHANNLADASLLAEPSAATPGEPFTAAVRLRVPPGWHLSWRNPGDAGLPPSLRWALPPGVSAGEIQWPVPHAIALGPVVSYGLEGDVWLLVELIPARALPLDGPLLLAVDAEWLVCQDLCIPEKAHLSLSLPASEIHKGPGVDAAGFLSARERIPRKLDWPVTLGRQDRNLKQRTAEVLIGTGALALPGARVQFFAYANDAVDPSLPQTFEPEPGGLLLSLPRPASARSELSELQGVLVIHGSDDLDEVAAEIATAPPQGQLNHEGPLPFWLAIVCAFAGGILLNLMPCVLPVLGFKIVNLVRDASDGSQRARIGGLAYAAGVIASFWALALVLLALRESGAQLGWGFQLQSPAVISLLAVLFFFLGLFFLGFIDWGSALQTRAGEVQLHFASTAWGAFGSGMLATAVATPCTAPFMGAALGTALISPPVIALAIFTALGLGMAWPYALLSFWPALLRLVPKPGSWMNRLQEALAFPMFVSALWLLTVLSAQAGPSRMTSALGAMLLVALAAWIWRRGGDIDARAAVRIFSALAAFLLVGLAIFIAIALPERSLATPSIRQRELPFAEAQAVDAADANAAVAWTDWSEERVAQLRAEGRTVFIDFTAAWCISCQVNQRLVFSSRAVRDRFAKLGVVPLRADWTRSDPTITRALQSFGRSGVPLNIVTGPRLAEPLVLPAVLTPGMVLDALEQVDPPHR